jgi:hypothetical protein
MNMQKRKLKFLRRDFGAITLREVAERFSPKVTPQAVFQIERTEFVKQRTARRYEEAVLLAKQWHEEMDVLRKRFRPIVGVELAKAARRVDRLRS